MNVRCATLSNSFSDELHFFKHDINFDGMNYKTKSKIALYI